MRSISLQRLLLTLLVGLAAWAVQAQEKDGFLPLFNGKDFDGWEQRNGTATYRVEDGCVVGKTSEGSPNSFLCTLKEYADFELKFEVKVANELNSGVQIRSKTKGGTKDGRVHGPQVEIAINGTAGFIYGEGLSTGWVSKDMENPKAKAAFKKGEWNSYHVKAVGKNIKTMINGIPITETVDDKTGLSSGFIGLQVHGIQKGTGPYEVRWRNIMLKEIK